MTDVLSGAPQGGSATATARRPLRTRTRRLPRAIAARLARREVSANAVSVGSVVVAVLGAGLLITAGRRSGSAAAGLLFGAAVTIQLRLLLNLLDGLIAVEGRRRTPTGVLYNEVPDRLADSLFLVAAGIASGGIIGISLGWAAALMAALTACVRLLGGSLGQEQRFCGPMAKPHRMAVLTATCVVAAGAEMVLGRGSDRVLLVGLCLITGGAAVTTGRRLRIIAAELERGR